MESTTGRAGGSPSSCCRDELEQPQERTMKSRTAKIASSTLRALLPAGCVLGALAAGAAEPAPTPTIRVPARVSARCAETTSGTSGNWPMRAPVSMATITRMAPCRTSRRSARETVIGRAYSVRRTTSSVLPRCDREELVRQRQERLLGGEGALDFSRGHRRAVRESIAEERVEPLLFNGEESA